MCACLLSAMVHPVDVYLAPDRSNRLRSKYIGVQYIALYTCNCINTKMGGHPDIRGTVV